MKYIKKVDVTQLVTNTGTIIDSMNSGDDQHTNAPSIDAVKNYVENYSTTEQKIGTWIDGKPLYRITVVDTIGTTNGSWKDVNVFSGNYVKNVVNINGVARIGLDSNAFWGIPFTRATDSNYTNREYILMNFNTGTGNLGIIAYHPSLYSDIYSGKTFYVHIYYTKTTD